MKIFVIARGFPTDRFPQWGCFEKDQAEALAAVGHEVVVLSVDTRFRLCWRKPWISQYEGRNIKAVNCFLLPSAIVGLCGRCCRESFEAWQLEQVYRRAVQLYGIPDVLYSHYLFISHRALHLKRRFGIPLVGIEHWSDINRPSLNPKVKRLAEATYPHLDAVVTVAQSLHDAVMHHFGLESMVVHNLFGSEFFYKDRKPTNDQLHFITTGSLIHRKGFDLLIAALAEAELPSEHWQLDILGEGELHSSLQKQINDAGLQDQIHLLGSMNKRYIANHLQQSDVFILPSRNENFSVAVLEALACGLPVISSICGGIRECIDERNGLLFPVDDKEALVSALRYMFQHHQDYDRRLIAEDCQQRFGAQTIARKLTEVFEQVKKQ